MTRLMAILAASLMAAACAETIEYQYVGTEILRNEEGHVIGHKELLLDASNGEEFEQPTYYRPMLNEQNEVIGYQQTVPGGTVIRSLDGRRIGARYSDLRSQGSNRGNEGITITFPPTKPAD
jgi:hypothetical protein